MIIKQISKVYNITVAEVKQHLRISSNFTQDDVYIQELIATSTQYIERRIHNELALNTYILTKKDCDFKELLVELGNYNSIQSVTLNDVVIDSSTLDIEETEFNFKIIFPNIIKGDLIINFRTGVSNLEFLLSIKRAIIIKVCDLYDNERGSYTLSSIKENMNVIEALISDYKKITFL